MLLIILPKPYYTQEAAVTLLEDKLSDIELSSANVSNPTWERQILSIIAYSPKIWCFIHEVLLETKLILDTVGSSLCLETECVITHV